MLSVEEGCAREVYPRFEGSSYKQLGQCEGIQPPLSIVPLKQ